MNESNYFLKSAAVITVGGTLSATVLGLLFLRVPPGASIRPMGAAVLLALISFFTLSAGIGFTLFGWKGQPRWLRWLAIPLAFAPFPMFHLALAFAQNVRGFTLAP